MIGWTNQIVHLFLTVALFTLLLQLQGGFFHLCDALLQLCELGNLTRFFVILDTISGTTPTFAHILLIAVLLNVLLQLSDLHLELLISDLFRL